MTINQLAPYAIYYDSCSGKATEVFQTKADLGRFVATHDGCAAEARQDEDKTWRVWLQLRQGQPLTPIRAEYIYTTFPKSETEAWEECANTDWLPCEDGGSIFYALEIEPDGNGSWRPIDDLPGTY